MMIGEQKERWKTQEENSKWPEASSIFFFFFFFPVRPRGPTDRPTTKKRKKLMHSEKETSKYFSNGWKKSEMRSFDRLIKIVFESCSRRGKKWGACSIMRKIIPKRGRDRYHHERGGEEGMEWTIIAMQVESRFIPSIINFFSKWSIPTNAWIPPPPPAQPQPQPTTIADMTRESTLFPCRCLNLVFIDKTGSESNSNSSSSPSSCRGVEIYYCCFKGVFFFIFYLWVLRKPSITNNHLTFGHLKLLWERKNKQQKLQASYVLRASSLNYSHPVKKCFGFSRRSIGRPFPNKEALKKELH